MAGGAGQHHRPVNQTMLGSFLTVAPRRLDHRYQMLLKSVRTRNMLVPAYFELHNVIEPPQARPET